MRALLLVVIAPTAFHCAPSWSGEVTGEASIKADVTRLLLFASMSSAGNVQSVASFFLVRAE